MNSSLDPAERTDQETTSERADATREQVDALIARARALGNDEPRDARGLADRALQLAEQIGYARGREYARALAGYADYMQSNLDSALDQSREALAYFEAEKDLDGQTLAIGTIAMTQRTLGNYEKAFELGLHGLKLIHASGDRAMEGWWQNGLGAGFYESGDYDRAMQYHREALRIFQEIGEVVGEARARTGLGTVLHALGRRDEALKFHQEAYFLYKDRGNLIGEARALNDLGLVYQHQGQYKEALERHRRSLELREQVGNRMAQCASLINLGKLYIQMQQAEEALEVLQRGLAMAEDIQARPRIHQAHEALADAHALAGDYEHALEHYKSFHAVREEISGDVAATRMKNLQIGWEVEKSEREAEIERLRNVELKDKNEQLQLLLRQLEAAQSQLIESERRAALGNLVAGVVHELTSPVGALASSVDVVMRSAERLRQQAGSHDAEPGEDSGGSWRNALQGLEQGSRVISDAARRITRICMGLRSFVRLDEAEYQRFDVHDCIEAALAVLEHRIEPEIRLQRDFGDLPEIHGYPAELNQVFMQLISNALTAMRGEGRLLLRTRPQDDHIRVEVADTGPGIPEALRPELFEPVFTQKRDRIKAGMGLFTARNIVLRHGGRIEFTSEIGRGTTFTVDLPTSVTRTGSAAS